MALEVVQGWHLEDMAFKCVKISIDRKCVRAMDPRFLENLKAAFIGPYVTKRSQNRINE